MEMLIVNDVLNVRRGMMRVGSSAKLLGFCCQEAGAGAVGGGGRLWGFLLWFGAGREHDQTDTWWARVSVEENQIFTSGY